MFNTDFYPTPVEVIETMLAGISLKGKRILEPSAGAGNIVDFILSKSNGTAEVIACEKDDKLREIVKGKCPVIASDFLSVESEAISHVDIIVMNPPFSSDERHILHAFEIAPPGCKIIALCNWQTLENTHTMRRRELKGIIETYGTMENLGDVFSAAERKTKVEVGLVHIQKHGASYDAEFEGFFLDEDPEEPQYNGLMPYNFVRDLVNRYVAAVKIYDQQLDSAVRLNSLLNEFYDGQIGFQCTEEGRPVERGNFKKALQKSGWEFVFRKMNMEKYATKGLKEDINKFVESQQHIPFTMRNIYRMLEIVIGTHGQRMDKALLEVFENITKYHHENRYNVPGWKTNSHYLVGRKFIMDGITEVSYHGNLSLSHYGTSRQAYVDDFQKALCHLIGRNYDEIQTMWGFFNLKEVPGLEGKYPRQYVHYEFGTWYEWGFFRVKGYKKGTMHFEFLDEDVWARFNQEIARLKGYPLFEAGHYRKQKKAA